MKPFDDLRSTAQAFQEENRQRSVIEHSDDYVSLQAQIDELLQKQQQLFAGIPDSREEYEMDKQEVIRYLTDNNLTDVEGFEVKTRKKNSVDTYAVLQALDGNLDNLMLVATVSQTALAKFAKENKGYSHLKNCIREEGYTITEIVVL